MAEKFPELKKEIDVQGQEVKRVPNKMNSNRLTVRHIIKMSVLRGKFTTIQDFIGNQEKSQKKKKTNPNLPPKRMLKLPYSIMHSRHMLAK